ncbi:hypothetical protein DFS33DRAFT_1374098 [Desarmillaria ectypa]|nr:hypothetical protein DFS33DRAFT_1374098 [Desarmillaria ectypa]
MTQAKAYRKIRKIKIQTETYQDKLDRRDTDQNVTLALAATNERCKAEITREQLWTSIRRKDLNRSARFFMWMLLHDGYTVGRHWKHIEGCEDRIECQTCGIEESMDDILTGEIWQLAQQLWKQKTKTDFTVTKGIIMSFCRIMISKYAHLIWKMRNDRVINDKPHHTTREIDAMNRRMKLDSILSDQKKYKTAIQKSLVLKTWQGMLLKESSLPEDWTKEGGVLVGIVK